MYNVMVDKTSIPNQTVNLEASTVLRLLPLKV